MFKSSAALLACILLVLGTGAVSIHQSNSLLVKAEIAQKNQVVLSGSVKQKETDKAIANATVKVYELVESADLPLVATLTTDAKGQFAGKLEPGKKFKLVATAAGYKQGAKLVSTLDIDPTNALAVVKSHIEMTPEK
jgi:hypothetical protein